MAESKETRTAADAAAFVDTTLGDAQEIQRLVGLPILECDRQCRTSALKLGCSVTALKAAVKAERARQSGAAEHGRALEIPSAEPWPDAVDAAAVLDELVTSVRRYVVVTDVQADAIALWTAHTHAHDAADASPKLVLKSPQMRSGKTRLVEVLSRVTARPLPISGVTPAALLRLIDVHHPTLLLDEIDAAMRGGKELAEALRGIINSGFNRAAAVFIKNVPVADGGYEPCAFSTWCPQLLSGIGDLPDTVRDRSIEIEMQRKTRDQKVDRLRRTDGGDLVEIAGKLARFAADNMTALRGSRPEMPTGLNDRAADAWEPLFAIADLAGGTWPERARRAALELCGDGTHDAENVDGMLLSDIFDIVKEVDTTYITSAELAEGLGAMKHRPWADWRNGHAITQNSLAKLLKPYKIRPGTIRLRPGIGGTQKGYHLSDFEDAFLRYLPPAPDSNRHTVTSAEGRTPDDSCQPSPREAQCQDEIAQETNKTAVCDGVTVLQHESGRCTVPELASEDI